MTIAITDIKPICKKATQQLFAFERDNAAYFERWITPRPAEYADIDTFTTITHELIAEMTTGVAYYGLIWVEGEIAGRINLRDIKDQRAELGYRIGESFAGKDVASAAVSQILTIAQNELDISTIDAEVASNNPASHRVLLNNHFSAFPTDKKMIEFAGEQLTLQRYRRLLAS